MLAVQQTDVMAVDWALLRGLVTAAKTVQQLVADESAQRMSEILGAVAEVHWETARRQWLDVRKLEGTERALKLEAVANCLEVAFTAREKQLDPYRPWEWLPERWEQTGRLKRLRLKSSEWLPEHLKGTKKLRHFREAAESASQIALINAWIYLLLGNRAPTVHDRVDDALHRFRQYMAIQTELFTIYGEVYEYGRTPALTVENSAAEYDYVNAMAAARNARALHRESSAALLSIKAMTRALTGVEADIAPLDSARYPDLEDQR
ncbi:hypothetical protein [Streptomyces sp. NPDC020742]|uniref:hypothetical protein n=1 Tax=Streptomyces sp. NPDC020742 TaxID=3154897 RepID=UPI0033CF9143